MFKIIILEIRAITRQYKDIYKISSKEAFMYLLFFMLTILLFYILSLFEIKLLNVQKIICVFSIFLSISIHKNFLYEYIKNKRIEYPEVFPLNREKFFYIKAIKYDYIVLMESLIIFIPIGIAFWLAGYSSLYNAIFFIITALLIYLITNNIVSVVKFLKMKLAKPVVTIFFKSLILVLFFYIVSIAISELEKIIGYLYNENKIDPFTYFDSLGYFFSVDIFNSIFIMLSFMILLIVVLLKVLLYSRLNLVNNMENKKGLLFNRIFFKSPILNKEIKYLASQGILEKVLINSFVYFMASILLLILNFIMKVEIIIPNNLVLLLLIGECLRAVEELSKNYLGNEKRYVENYILSGFDLTNLLINKIILNNIIILVSMLPILILFSIVFKFTLAFFLLALVCLILNTISFSIISVYFNSAKTSFVNKLAIPHRYAPYKKMAFNTMILYSNLIIIIFFELLFNGWFRILLSMVILIVQTLIVIISFSLILRKKREVLYGEYSYSVYKENR